MDADCQYADAVWRWLRCEDIVEPDPRTFGVPENIAEVIKIQCQIEFKNQRT